MKNKGFTLIELLVVIAIIGILSSVVLASLNSARAKGSDAAIKSSLANARAQAELYYDGAGQSYLGMCAAATGTNAIWKSVQGLTTNAVCQDNGGTPAGSSWAMSADLKATPNTSWCVDSTGKSASGTAVSGVCQ